MTPLSNLWPTIQDRLRHIAAHLLARERRDHTLQPTALVHEAFLRLQGDTAVDVGSPAMLYRAAAGSMRRVLIDHARSVARHKRRAPGHRVDAEQVSVMPIDPALVLDVEAAIDRLAKASPEHAEIMNLRFFGSLTEEEVAEALGLSRRKVQMCIKSAGAYLRTLLDGDEQNEGTDSAA